jgi:hypothetical protein
MVMSGSDLVVKPGNEEEAIGRERGEGRRAK